MKNSLPYPCDMLLKFFDTSLFFFNNLQEANKPPDSWFELKVNTHVYVTGLPDDVTFDEVSCAGYFLKLSPIYNFGD